MLTLGESPSRGRLKSRTYSKTIVRPVPTKQSHQVRNAQTVKITKQELRTKGLRTWLDLNVVIPRFPASADQSEAHFRGGRIPAFVGESLESYLLTNDLLTNETA